MGDASMELEYKLRTRQASLGVIGLGYVGLPLALTFSRAGYAVTGLDVDSKRVAALSAGHSYITDVSDSDIAHALKERRLIPTTDMDQIAGLDVVTICVPTPLRKTKEPDLSYIMAAIDAITQRLRRGQLIVLESTTYPGTTEELVLPKLQETGLKVGKDFFLAFSPERVDPGNQNYSTQKIPKVVGGTTPRCSELAALLYGECVDQVHVVSSTRVAEMVKLLENTFRSVNIALVNEIALMCSHTGIDVWEVIQAAATKPFGFMPFYPGPGLGGHCIPIDPIYLLWKARADGFPLRFIDLADEINSSMPRTMTIRAMELLNQQGIAFKGARVHILGVSYKRDISDTRESPALEIMKLSLTAGAIVSYSDPFVPALTLQGRDFHSLPVAAEVLRSCDLAIIVTDHSQFDYECIVNHAPLVFDTRNATNGLQAENVVRG
ncbi:MAG: UDP-N-acetyl-D-glucosamine dehydrogenase [Acidobacteria bacterium RIFCSPLOWO2_12_FULL_54_10]|nr:MAG: UDP-N-acetyl-D-glucosamine dehydrogenase [Acidobacteria bacterium RIFCSPLOWO2_12_FULL_54_10]